MTWVGPTSELRVLCMTQRCIPLLDLHTQHELVCALLEGVHCAVLRHTEKSLGLFWCKLKSICACAGTTRQMGQVSRAGHMLGCHLLSSACAGKGCACPSRPGQGGGAASCAAATPGAASSQHTHQQRAHRPAGGALTLQPLG
jgi:hypothetical protein